MATTSEERALTARDVPPQRGDVLDLIDYTRVTIVRAGGLRWKGLDAQGYPHYCVPSTRDWMEKAVYVSRANGGLLGGEGAR